MRSQYKISANDLTGDAMWQIDDVDLPITDGGASFCREFISQHYHEGYTLSIFDTLTGQTIEIECAIESIPEIVSYIYNLEHASPMTFIGINSLSDSYVVGMALTKHRISFGDYVEKNGKLEKQVQ